MKILIVDDEPPARLRLRQLLAEIDREGALAVSDADSGRAALAAAGATKCDLVLLDIHMPDMSGLEVARHLMKLPDAPAVVFVTAFDDHALEAFEVHAIDYLLKPVRRDRLAEALRRAAPDPVRVDEVAQALGDRRSHLTVTERGQLLLVPVDEVVFLRAEQKYVTIRTAAREFLTEESLTALEAEFGTRFIRIHRNTLVARATIRGFARVRDAASEDGDGHWEVLLQGVAERLPVSRRQWPEVKALVRT
jgi:two-component system response regulator AlgR